MRSSLMGLLVLTLVCALLPATSAMAELRYDFGPKGGVTIADLIGDDASDTQTLVGFSVGAFWTAYFNEFFGARVEGFFTRNGAEDDFGDQLKLDYLEFPVLAVGVFPVGDLSNVFAFAGPAFAFNVGADVEGTDVSDLVKSFDFRGVLGAGAEFDVGQFLVVFDARWAFGFTSFDDSDFDADVKNSVFSFLGGLAFPFGATE